MVFGAVSSVTTRLTMEVEVFIFQTFSNKVQKRFVFFDQILLVGWAFFIRGLLSHITSLLQAQ